MSYSVTVNVGRSGFGKSYAAKRKVDKWRGTPVVVWDLVRDWAGPKAKDPPRRKPVIVHDFGEFLRRQSQSTRLLAPYLVFQLDHGDFDAWCKWVWATGRMLVVIDEAHLVSRPGSGWRKVGGGRARPAPFFKLMTTARHRELDLVICTQRPQTVPRDATAQVTELFCWRTTESVDLAWLADVAGKEWAEGLRALGDHDALRWEP